MAYLLLTKYKRWNCEAVLRGCKMGRLIYIPEAADLLGSVGKYEGFFYEFIQSVNSLIRVTSITHRNLFITLREFLYRWGLCSRLFPPG